MLVFLFVQWLPVCIILMKIHTRFLYVLINMQNSLAPLLGQWDTVNHFTIPFTIIISTHPVCFVIKKSFIKKTKCTCLDRTLNTTRKFLSSGIEEMVCLRFYDLIIIWYFVLQLFCCNNICSCFVGIMILCIVFELII